MIEQLGMRRHVAGHAEVVDALTRPWPNRCCQTRLTITRGVSGFFVAGQPLRQLEPAALAAG